MKFKAVIFDLDGTLLDSMNVWEQIDIDFLAKRGFEATPDYINEICSRSFSEAATYTIEHFGLPDDAASLIEEWNAMAVYAYGHTVELKKHAKEYLGKLKERGVKLGIATSLPPVLYSPALRNHQVEHFFDVICSTDEVARGKTYPDVFLYAAEKLDIAPQQCLVFEDIPQAVKSAKSAGMKVVGIYDKSSKKYWEEIKNMADGALYDFQNAPLPK